MKIFAIILFFISPLISNASSCITDDSYSNLMSQSYNIVKAKHKTEIYEGDLCKKSNIETEMDSAGFLKLFSLGEGKNEHCRFKKSFSPSVNQYCSILTSVKVIDLCRERIAKSLRINKRDEDVKANKDNYLQYLLNFRNYISIEKIDRFEIKEWEEIEKTKPNLITFLKDLDSKKTALQNYDEIKKLFRIFAKHIRPEQFSRLHEKKRFTGKNIDLIFKTIDSDFPVLSHENNRKLTRLKRFIKSYFDKYEGLKKKKFKEPIFRGLRDLIVLFRNNYHGDLKECISYFDNPYVSKIDSVFNNLKRNMIDLETGFDNPDMYHHYNGTTSKIERFLMKSFFKNVKLSAVSEILKNKNPEYLENILKQPNVCAIGDLATIGIGSKNIQARENLYYNGCVYQNEKTLELLKKISKFSSSNIVDLYKKKEWPSASFDPKGYKVALNRTREMIKPLMKLDPTFVKQIGLSCFLPYEKFTYKKQEILKKFKNLDKYVNETMKDIFHKRSLYSHDLYLAYQRCSIFKDMVYKSIEDEKDITQKNKLKWLDMLSCVKGYDYYQYNFRNRDFAKIPKDLLNNLTPSNKCSKKQGIVMNFGVSRAEGKVDRLHVSRSFVGISYDDLIFNEKVKQHLNTDFNSDLALIKNKYKVLNDCRSLHLSPLVDSYNKCSTNKDFPEEYEQVNFVFEKSINRDRKK